MPESVTTHLSVFKFQQLYNYADVPFRLILISQGVNWKHDFDVIDYSRILLIYYHLQFQAPSCVCSDGEVDCMFVPFQSLIIMSWYLLYFSYHVYGNDMNLDNWFGEYLGGTMVVFSIRKTYFNFNFHPQ